MITHYENRRQGFQGLAEEFLVAPWGERRYLIPPDRIIAFCNAVTTRLFPERPEKPEKSPPPSRPTRPPRR